MKSEKVGRNDRIEEWRYWSSEVAAGGIEVYMEKNVLRERKKKKKKKCENVKKVSMQSSHAL